MTDTATPAMLADLRLKLARQQERLQALDWSKADGGSSFGWIVVTGHCLPIDFTVDSEGRLGNPRIGLTHTVRRMHMRMALRCAKQIHDGTGAASRAVRIDHAMEDDIVRTLELIKALEDHLENVK